MILLIDLGNTRLKWALWDRGLTGCHAFLVDKADFAKTLVSSFKVLPEVERAIVVSVADKDRTTALKSWLLSKRNIETTEIRTQKEAFGVVNEYEKIETLGADRWVALVAARQHSRKATVVIDCGTAVTIDVLDGLGNFKGGVILPGRGLMQKSLNQTAAGIDVEAMSVERVWGTSTQEAVAVGCVFGLAGAIERVVRGHINQLGGEANVLLTGGDADTLKPYLPDSYECVPDLVFEGMAIMTTEFSDS